MARILDDDDHRTRQRVPRCREHCCQSIDHVCGARVVEPKENDPPGSISREGLRAPDFLAGQPGRVLQGLLDVLWLEVGVALQDVGHRRAVGDLADDH